MSGEKHTAGPWEAVRMSSPSDDWIIHTQHPTIPDVMELCNASEADARMAAAAPEMFEVVERVSRLTVEGEDEAAFENKYPEFAGLVRQAKAALAKAQPSQKKGTDHVG